MFHSISPRDIVPVLLIAVLSASVGLGLPRLLPIVQVTENWLADFRFGALASPEPQNADVVVLTITEDTLAALPYRSPVDRGFLAALLRKLDEARPAAIGIDILFDQPTEPAKDNLLRKTLLELSTPVVVASAGKGFGLTKKQAAYLGAFTSGIRSGPANLAKDGADGTVRWIYAGETIDGKWRPGFMSVIADLLGRSTPKDDLDLAYRPPPDSKTPAFKRFPAHTAAFLPKPWLAGKVFLIGADLPMIDRHRTPFAAARGARAGSLPGVVVHAHALAQLLDGRNKPALGTGGTAALVLAVAVLGLAVAALDAVTAVKGLLVAVIVAAVWIGGFAAYGQTGLMLPLLPPSIAFLIGSGGGVAYLGRRDREQKRYIREAFSHFVSRSVVDQLIADPDQLKVGGDRRELTFLFTDMASFTSLTERTEPEALVKLLWEYMGGMLDIALKHDATLDKLIGDAVVAFFNAPVEQPDHRARAVACALEMDAFGQRFVEDQAARGVEVGITRIGVHTGIATVGNFGSEQFFDYTGLGDTVNTAARLESVNKHLGTRVCISETTARQCPDLEFRQGGALVLKGKEEAIEVFEPVSDDSKTMRAVTAYAEAFRYMEEDNPEAVTAFRNVLELNPEDGLAAFHLKRLESGESGTRIVMGEK